MAGEPPRRRRGDATPAEEERRAAPRGGARRPSGPSRASSGRPQRQRKSRSDLVNRVVIAIPAAVVAVVFVDLGGTPFAALMVLMGWACVDELYRMLERWRPATSAGLGAVAGMVLAARFGGLTQVLLVAVAAVPATFFLLLMRRERQNATISIAGTLFGVYWIGLAFAHAELLRQLPHGGAILIDVLVGTFLGDTAAYLGGRMFGRRPLAPNISPSKTVEGLICGMLAAIVSVLIAGTFQSTWLDTQNALVLGVGVAIAGPTGDLFESLVKRDAGAKDAGTLFGAHGGALDRLDGAIFTVVLGYYIWLALK